MLRNLVACWERIRVFSATVHGVTKDSFGPLIAYLVPGATALVGLSQFSQTLRSWYAPTAVDAPTIGGFLYLTVASVAMGMTVSAIRWAIVDHVHAHTGLTPPELDFSKLTRNVTAFSLLIEIHYQHYQFYTNMFVATAIAYGCHRISIGSLWPTSWIDLGFVILEVIFFCTSRDTLSKYHVRSRQLLGDHSGTTNPGQAKAFSATVAPAAQQTERASGPEPDKRPAAE